MHHFLKRSALPVAIIAVLGLFALGILEVKAPSTQTSTPPSPTPNEEASNEPEFHEFIEIIEGCGPHYEGECLHAYSAPNASSTEVAKLRTGMVLKVSETLRIENDVWHHIAFEEWLRYPGRVNGGWYVRAEGTRSTGAPAEEILPPEEIATSTKRIIVDRSEQKLYAYEGDELFMETQISTGLGLTPTPRGTFTVYRKTPSRYMQGPLPGISDQFYDLPGVPWNLYFTKQGGVIHGAYWHDKFGQPWSHGCVNVSLEDARKLYGWADLGTQVVVRD